MKKKRASHRLIVDRIFTCGEEVISYKVAMVQCDPPDSGCQHVARQLFVCIVALLDGAMFRHFFSVSLSVSLFLLLLPFVCCSAVSILAEQRCT